MAQELNGSSNFKENEDDSTKSAINAMLHSHQETYDQFLKGFTQLTMADVTQSCPSTMQNDLNTGTLQKLLASMESHLMPDLSISEKIEEGLKMNQSMDHNQCISSEQKEISSDNDDLDEEVLDGGFKTVDPLLRASSTCTLTKVDNFFDESDINSEDSNNEEESGYQASFSCKVKKETSDISSDRIIGQILSENSICTNKNRIDEQEHCENSVADECSQYETSANRENETAGKQITETDVENKFLDSCHNLYPGEADEDIICSDKPVDNTRLLDFSTSILEHQEPSNCSYMQQEKKTLYFDQVKADCVEPFQLDVEFDYDNVVLTPKFTANEMQYLTSLLPKSSPHAQSTSSQEGETQK